VVENLIENRRQQAARYAQLREAHRVSVFPDELSSGR